jgi:short-subunit dehydrogenase
LPSRNLKIDLLINNAGPSLTGDFLSHDVAKELASIQINVQALAGLSHALGAKMVSRGVPCPPIQAVRSGEPGAASCCS